MTLYLSAAASLLMHSVDYRIKTDLEFLKSAIEQQSEKLKKNIQNLSLEITG